MSKNTDVVCLADGAENCKSIAYSIKDDCHTFAYILDWFHIAKKIQNIVLTEEYKDSLNNVKWICSRI